MQTLNNKYFYYALTNIKLAKHFILWTKLFAENSRTCTTECRQRVE